MDEAFAKAQKRKQRAGLAPRASADDPTYTVACHYG